MGRTCHSREKFKGGGLEIKQNLCTQPPLLSIYYFISLKLQHPTPGIWTFEDRFVQILTPWDKHCVQMPCPIFWWKWKSLYTGHTLKPRRPFLLSHCLPLTDSIFVFSWKDLTLPAQIPHPHQARFKFLNPRHRCQSNACRLPKERMSK